MKKPEKSQKTEQIILNTAQQTFAEQGLSGARMQAIAKEAKVNKALLHYYFRSKEKLYEAVLKNIIGQVWTTIRQEMKAENKSQKIEEVIRIIVSAYVRTLRNNPVFPRIMLHEMAVGGTHLSVIVEELVGSFGDLLGRLMVAIQAGVKERRIKPIEPVHIIINLMGMTIATFLLQPIIPLFYYRVFKSEFKADDAFFEKRIEVITETLCNGILVRKG
ncbi:MAG: hypothetical protein A2293_10695 [Elusimicrobia bacterium RIFOXYB2_FULL_49_7]|nr:MAG: hypothetical protein A2293_10695 [Elusimicrobia bacterium RIFOXYB2_FULL_49_7]